MSLFKNSSNHVHMWLGHLCVTNLLSPDYRKIINVRFYEAMERGMHWLRYSKPSNVWSPLC